MMGGLLDNTEDAKTSGSQRVILPNHVASQWETIKTLLQDVANGKVQTALKLVQVLTEIMTIVGILKYQKSEKLRALCNFLKARSEAETAKLFGTVFPSIAVLALRLEEYYPEGHIDVTRPLQEGTMTVSRSNVACLLANMFFCTFPLQTNVYIVEYTFYGLMCDDMMFLQKMVSQKLLCLMDYFESVLSLPPTGVLTITRNCLSPEACGEEAWDKCELLMKDISVRASGGIEDTKVGLLVDFANEYVGGGIDATCLQEQILFIIHPELFVGCLLCARMKPQEAVIITGAQRFSNYKGYEATFEYTGKADDPLRELRDASNRIPRHVVAIDALSLVTSEARYNQFSLPDTLRELNKAYAGFLGDHIQTGPDTRPVITGKWGCGVFNGCTQYKLLIQWLAASRAGRDVEFCSFNDPSVNDIKMLKARIVGRLSVRDCYRLLVLIGGELEKKCRTKHGFDYSQVPFQLLAKHLP